MGPRFDTTLYFECDGTLEVCGPIGFDADDVLLEITSIEITQGAVGPIQVLSQPLITVSPSAMWETELSNATGQGLVPGPAQAVGVGFFVLRRGGRLDVTWPGQLTLVDGCAIYANLAPKHVSTRATFNRRRRRRRRRH